MQQNCFFSHLELQNFLGRGPPNPPYPSRPPPSCRRHSVNTNGVQMAVPLSKSRRRPCINMPRWTLSNVAAANLNGQSMSFKCPSFKICLCCLCVDSPKRRYSENQNREITTKANWGLATINKSGPKVIKLFPCSTQLSMK